jgi:hypothetical protein
MTPGAWYGRFFAVTVVAVGTGCSSGDGGGRCGSIDACGGEVTGTWQLTSSCVEGNLTAAVNLNQDLPAACRGAYKSVVASVTGTVAFNAGTATNNTTTTIDYDFVANGNCLTAFGVPVSDMTAACAALGPAMIAGKFHNVVNCAVEGGGCHCTAKNEYPRQETLPYTVQGSKLSYSTGGDSMDFCVEGSTLRSRQFATELVTTVFFVATKAD